MDQRIAEVAHDLKIPLALIRDHCEHLSATVRDAAELVEIRQISETVERMSVQVDGLLQAGNAARAPVDVAALTRGVAARLRPLAHARGVSLTVEGSASATVIACREEVEIALQNVLDNALRHARDQPVRINVREGLRRVSIEIADDGPGIPASQRRRLLEPGTSGIGHGQQPGSAGLGLSICKRAVEAQGGRLRIGRSQAGGTLVTLDFPAYRSRSWRRQGRVAAAG